jgi:hypothetical protein
MLEVFYLIFTPSNNRARETDDLEVSRIYFYRFFLSVSNRLEIGRQKKNYSIMWILLRLPPPPQKNVKRIGKKKEFFGCRFLSTFFSPLPLLSS